MRGFGGFGGFGDGGFGGARGQQQGGRRAGGQQQGRKVYTFSFGGAGQ